MKVTRAIHGVKALLLGCLLSCSSIHTLREVIVPLDVLNCMTVNSQANVPVKDTIDCMFHDLHVMTIYLKLNIV